MEIRVNLLVLDMKEKQLKNHSTNYETTGN